MEHIPLKILFQQDKLYPSITGSTMHPWHYLDIASTNLDSHFTYSDIHTIPLSMYMYIYIYVGTSLAPFYLIHPYLLGLIIILL